MEKLQIVTDVTEAVSFLHNLSQVYYNVLAQIFLKMIFFHYCIGMKDMKKKNSLPPSEFTYLHKKDQRYKSTLHILKA